MAEIEIGSSSIVVVTVFYFLEAIKLSSFERGTFLGFDARCFLAIKLIIVVFFA